MIRTHHCNELTKQHVGKIVTLMGWVHGRRDHGGVFFIDLRDRYGVTQLVFDIEKNPVIHERANELRNEFVIAVTGQAKIRPEESIYLQLVTGEIEVEVVILQVLNQAKTPPFVIEDDVEATESIRLQHRYLDLRRPRMQKLLKLRHDVTFHARQFLHQRGFLEIETPI